jgi:hypothetical protein
MFGSIASSRRVVLLVFGATDGLFMTKYPESSLVPKNVGNRTGSYYLRCRLYSKRPVLFRIFWEQDFFVHATCVIMEVEFGASPRPSFHGAFSLLISDPWRYYGGACMKLP